VDGPRVQYAKSGDVHIAYQVIGSGAIDLVLIPGLFSNIDHHWEEPGFARFLRRLASFTRLMSSIREGRGSPIDRNIILRWRSRPTTSSACWTL
jgi:hypothetical protein